MRTLQERLAPLHLSKYMGHTVYRLYNRHDSTTIIHIWRNVILNLRY